MIFNEYIKFINKNNLGNISLTIDEKKASFKAVVQSYSKEGLICAVKYDKESNSFSIEESNVCINFYPFTPVVNEFETFLKNNRYENIYVNIDEVKNEAICRVMANDSSIRKYKLEKGSWTLLN